MNLPRYANTARGKDNNERRGGDTTWEHERKETCGLLLCGQRQKTFCPGTRSLQPASALQLAYTSFWKNAAVARSPRDPGVRGSWEAPKERPRGGNAVAQRHGFPECRWRRGGARCTRETHRQRDALTLIKPDRPHRSKRGKKQMYEKRNR